MTKKPKILVIDDERNTREGLREALEDDYDVLLAEDGLKGLALLDANPDVCIALTDLRMPGMDGMDFVRTVSARKNAPLVIMLTAYGSVQTAVEALKVGAYDYLSKPVDLDNLEMMIDRGMKVLRDRTEKNGAVGEGGAVNIIGSSAAMTAVLDSIRQVATTKATVLVTGESGTGKELVAQAIHKLSPRANKAFKPVHCAALSENLLESELFGHEKGAFTGANERVAGRFEMADGGTLFLDEIGEISLAVQVKLLRVLETHQFERVGGSETLTVDVRVVAATNRDLKAMVEQGTFREDLFYRLNVVNIRIPALRERREDIPEILDYYLKKSAADNGKDVSDISPEALGILMAYDWPGNVRELRNCVERMVVFARGATLTVTDVPVDIRSAVGEQFEVKPASTEKPSAERTELLRDVIGLNVKENEKSLIMKALEECGGNRSKAAQKLNISRRTLYRKLHEYGLAGEEGEGQG
ncbi:MAG: sigma-54-dependent Fis family transcriptional regulator [Victivallales bacterium]|nr:sigma-54-dependent Fis family transcriptional regulator [Victivallales bacterium]